MLKSPSPQNMSGICFMLVNSLSMSLLYVVNKYLMGFLDSNLVVFAYKFAVLLGILPWILHGGIDCIRTKKIKLHLLRGILSTVGALLFFHGLSKVDVASATALNKMEPVLLMLVSLFYFKEKLSGTKISATIMSCIGMLFVIYPLVTYTNTGLHIPLLGDGSEAPEFNYNYLIVLGGVLFWTANSSVVKALGKTESNRTQLFYISVFSVIVSLPTALFKWEWIDAAGMNILWITDTISFMNFKMEYLGFIALGALFHFIHMASYFQSLKIAEMSVVIPFDYSRLIFGGALGYYFFNNVPSFSSCIGYVLILISGIFLLRAEAKIRKKI